MKNTIKALTAGIAAVAASAAIISTAGAAVYIDQYGDISYDNSNDYTIYYEDCYGYYYRHKNVKYKGEDEFYGSIFYDPVIGYYSYNGGDSYIHLGWDFCITVYKGTDRYGRYVYYSDDIGYFVISGSNYISYGYDISNVAW